ncbi:OmpA family protein [Luteolibacter sp. Populi]|uniref:OmpA family protein n=1 Tax=Luteolibacter sp. Populi TaxID=3230487 RepID=UPI00346581A8
MKANFHAPPGSRRLSLILAATVSLASVALAQTTSPDSRPVTDQSRAAGNDSRPVTDEAGKAGTDVTKVEDSNPQKASPDARRNKDTSVKASPEAARLNDGNADKANPASRQLSPDDRRKSGPQPASEIDKGEAPVGTEDAVIQAADETEAALLERKLQIRGETDARVVIAEILGKNSRNSRAEVAREQQDRLAREDAPKQDAPTATDERRAAVDFLRQRLSGDPAAETPAFFRLPVEVWQEGADRLNAAKSEPPKTPRYLHNGQRYVYFQTRETIPAVLLANAAFDPAVKARPAQELIPIFQADDAAWSGALLPEDYKGEDAWVISYPVDTKAMVTSHDIIFTEGSTRIADRHGYDLVLALSETVIDPALGGSRFIIEDHSSAEGSYDNNQALSQRRAEAIVREMVRLGVPAERLIPVGFGEGEAQHPAEAEASERSKDRRIMVFRLGGPVAK